MHSANIQQCIKSWNIDCYMMNLYHSYHIGQVTTRETSGMLVHFWEQYMIINQYVLQIWWVKRLFICWIVVSWASGNTAGWLGSLTGGSVWVKLVPRCLPFSSQLIVLLVNTAHRVLTTAASTNVAVWYPHATTHNIHCSEKNTHSVSFISPWLTCRFK